jgi:hypothetical protein
MIPIDEAGVFASAELSRLYKNIMIWYLKKAFREY